MTDPPTTAADYRPEFVALVKATLVEVAVLLHDCIDDFVVVGGVIASRASSGTRTMEPVGSRLDRPWLIRVPPEEGGSTSSTHLGTTARALGRHRDKFGQLIHSWPSPTPIHRQPATNRYRAAARWPVITTVPSRTMSERTRFNRLRDTSCPTRSSICPIRESG